MTHDTQYAAASSTPAPPRVVWLSWSSGKDSAWTLHTLQTCREVTVTGLVTTVNAQVDRVSMHGVRRELLQAQADALGLPLQVVELPSPCTNETYERHMRALTRRAVAAGVTHFAFGDLLLADIRAYREQQLDGTGIQPLFPLWDSDTHTLPQHMLAAGLKATATCIDPHRVPAHLAGQPFDADFLAALPDEVDPCGENGEFHTFVTDGPGFTTPVPVTIGETVDRDGLRYTDLLPGHETRTELTKGLNTTRP